jgi:cholesterol oxidase
VDTYDYVIIGSGFGGSVAAMRLAERGYRVLVLERGLRFADEDFATSTWQLRRYLWAPSVGCYSVMWWYCTAPAWEAGASGTPTS